MDKIIWVEQIGRIRNAKVLFDTNIWVMIEGFSEGAPRRKVEAYSAAYDTLLRNDNVVLYNDYIINEFCNICARIEYGTFLSGAGDKKALSFKEFRKTDQFRSAMVLIREACLNIVESCQYASVQADLDVSGIVSELCAGKLDFTDIVLRDYCRSHSVLMLTDDSDFRGCGLTIITANRGFVPDSGA